MNFLEVVYLSCLNFNGLIWGKGTKNPHLPVPCRGHEETAEECALWLEKDTKVKCTPLVQIVTRIVVTSGGETGEISPWVTFTKDQWLGTLSPTYTLIFPDSGHLPLAKLTFSSQVVQRSGRGMARAGVWMFLEQQIWACPAKGEESGPQERPLAYYDL